MENDTTTPKKQTDFWVRLLTGSIYCAILIVFFALKLFVSDLFFDAILVAFTVIGTFEMLRAFRDRLTGRENVIVMTFAILVILTYAVSDFIFSDVLGVESFKPGEHVTTIAGRNYSILITCGMFLAGLAVLFSLLVFRHEETSLESVGYSLFAYIYPSNFIVVLAVCNHLEIYSELALMFVFVLCPFSDSFALLFGRGFGKLLPMKMAPSVSPKKTLIGGFGGLFGGALGAVAIFFCCYGIGLLSEAHIIADVGWTLEINAMNLLFFIGLGVLTAAFSQFGDLVESAIKRKIGIKDMGKLLPGHGGILDRIDSALYAGLIVCLVMVIRIMIIG